MVRKLILYLGILPLVIAAGLFLSVGPWRIEQAKAISVSPSSIAVSPGASFSFTVSENYNKSSKVTGSCSLRTDYAAAFRAVGSWGWAGLPDGQGAFVTDAGRGTGYINGSSSPGSYSYTWSASAPDSAGSYSITVYTAYYVKEQRDLYGACSTIVDWYYIDPVATQTITVQVIGQPQARTASLTCGSGNIFVQWPKVDGANDYWLYRNDTLIAAADADAGYFGNPDAPSYTDSSASCGGSYSYKVKAYFPGGASSSLSNASNSVYKACPADIFVASFDQNGNQISAGSWTINGSWRGWGPGSLYSETLSGPKTFTINPDIPPSGYQFDRLDPGSSSKTLNPGEWHLWKVYWKPQTLSAPSASASGPTCTGGPPSSPEIKISWNEVSN